MTPMSKPMKIVKSIAIGIVAANLLGWLGYGLCWSTRFIWADNWIKGLSFTSAVVALVVLILIDVATDKQACG